MFEFFNPFRYFQAKKRARLEAEKQIALRKVEREEAAREAKRRLEYANHLEELRQIVKNPKVSVLPKSLSHQGEYQPTYSSPESVTNLLNSISEQSRVTAFEFGSTDTGTVDRADCPSASDSSSSSSDSGSSCGND